MTTVDAAESLPIWVFALLFVVLFLVIAFFIPMLSGWSQLVERYRAVGSAPVPLKHNVEGRVGFMNYGHGLSVGGDERGLYLESTLLFGLFHAPVRIPWAEIRARTQESFLFSQTDVFQVGFDGVEIRLQASATEALESYFPTSR
ncbi:hypothetical protein ACN469_36175 [Corallococcus terminator]